METRIKEVQGEKVPTTVPPGLTSRKPADLEEFAKFLENGFNVENLSAKVAERCPSVMLALKNNLMELTNADQYLVFLQDFVSTRSKQIDEMMRLSESLTRDLAVETKKVEEKYAAVSVAATDPTSPNPPQPPVVRPSSLNIPHVNRCHRSGDRPNGVTSIKERDLAASNNTPSTPSIVTARLPHSH